MMIPGVQKPHWLAPVSLKASAQRSRTAGSSPSRVVTSRPATRRTGVTQATRAAPSTQTVQHPHCPWGLQPSLGVRRPSRSRRASRSEIPVVGDLTVSPSTMKVTAVGAGCRAPELGQLNEEPQPQVREALGFEMWNPAPWRPSEYSRMAPVSSSALAASTTTFTVPNSRTMSSAADLGVEEHLVAVARAPSGADGHPQGQGVVALLGQQVGDLGGGLVRQGDRIRLPPDADPRSSSSRPCLLCRGSSASTRASPGPHAAPALYPSTVEPPPPAADVPGAVGPLRTSSPVRSVV